MCATMRRVSPRGCRSRCGSTGRNSPASPPPALLIHGKDDRVVSYENTLLLLAHIPDSRAVLLNRCGHWVMIEHAEEFNRLVADFVAVY
ncbi:alpha/beta hydrolase [Nocardia sp. NPDC004568]|uniref:alpha/beta fold hydrolase n=1 Tax=Nocardia sp. NPDC004568 TaxID=3154551 RepID=UPI0033B0AD58